MIRFLLNQEEIETSQPPGSTLLDFIRYHRQLSGTKIGCREGDCGACTVLIAGKEKGQLRFRNITSCLTAIGNIHGKQVITIEGLNLPEGLNPAQEAMARHSASQCGFCTPGFVVSLSAYVLNGNPDSDPVDCIAGNICRCTGYKSIEKAALDVQDFLKNKPEAKDFEYLLNQGLMPAWMKNIPERLQQLEAKIRQGEMHPAEGRVLGGGTDLYVQRHDEMTHSAIRFINQEPELDFCRHNGNSAETGAATPVSRWLEWPALQAHFSGWEYLKNLISSEPIRNIATLAGNFVNASPIGDLSIFFLALGAELELRKKNDSFRRLPLRDFFLSYKKTALQPGEWISVVRYELPTEERTIHFEKVCKRRNLDIASVNAALCLSIREGLIRDAGLAGGGIAGVPLFLREASAWLEGKKPDMDTLNGLLEMADREISPISDVRGTAAYKRLLFAQLIKSLFLRHFPELASGFQYQPA